jgi:hypothetical protein
MRRCTSQRSRQTSDCALVLAVETIPDLRISSGHGWLYCMMNGEIKDKNYRIFNSCYSNVLRSPCHDAGGLMGLLDDVGSKENSPDPQNIVSNKLCLTRSYSNCTRPRSCARPEPKNL